MRLRRSTLCSPKKIKSKDITEINVALPQTTTILFLPLFDNDQVQAAICTCLVCTLKLILDAGRKNSRMSKRVER